MKNLYYLCGEKLTHNIFGMANWNWELIGIAIGIITTILGGVWLILSKVFGLGRFSQRFEELDKRTEHASCKSHGEDIIALKSDIASVKGDVIAIKSLLMMKHKDAASVFSIKNSPRKLNELGSRLYAEIQGQTFLEHNQAFFFSKIDAFQPKTALDVENAAHVVCTAYTDNDIFNELKNFVYNSPSYKVTDAEGRERMYDLALSDVCYILSLPLRDMYLQAHPEIETE